MRENKSADKRVKAKDFPISIVILSFVAFGVFATGQFLILAPYVDTTGLSTISVIAILASWLLAAVSLATITVHQVNKLYRKPIKDFAEAARKVSSGDFSVYLAPRHTIDKADPLDALFMDFNKMVAELGSIETLKTDFFSNVSHEIKTPLAVIQTNAELLDKGGITEEKKQDCIDNIRHATRRLSNLISNMLRLNKLEKQVIRPRPEAFDLCAQLCQCALQFEDQWEKKNIEFEADIEDCAMIEADEELLELVWTNLLSNALKFTPADGKITITQTSESDYVTVRISDTGCGMSETTRKRIFDKFYQGDTSHATEGNGLGLALVNRIVQLSEGSIEVESTVGKGSTFTVRLPVSIYQTT